MKRIFILFLLGCLCSAIHAQTITSVEYFFDSDPGFGNGTSVSITPAPTITGLSFPVDVSSQATGFHTLYVRGLDSNGSWSMSFSKPFYKAPNIAVAPNITKTEYFIDADPGYGAGVDVPVTAATAITNLAVTIPLTALSNGSHSITFRSQDANGNWSIVYSQSFSVCNQSVPTLNAATAISDTGFTANWSAISGAASYQLDVSTDDFNTFITGYNSKTIIAPATSATIPGLTPTTPYQYRVRSVGSCVSLQSDTVNVTTLTTPPTAQPTNLLFTSINATSYSASFTAPTTPPSGYLVIRKAGSYTTFLPVDNQSYNLNDITGDGTVAAVGNITAFDETGLTPATGYYYTLFSYNQSGSFITYLTTSPLSNNVSTLSLEPISQPTNLQFSSVTSNSFTVSFTAGSDGPQGYIVLRKIGSAPSGIPVDGNAYTTQVQTDAIAYQGSGTSFNESGLVQNTNYYYTIYSFNGNGVTSNYQIVSPLEGNVLTPITAPTTAPTNIIFSNITPSAITISYTAATGSVVGYVAVRKWGGSSSFVPLPNTSYITGQVLSIGDTVAYAGTSLSFTNNGLGASNNYYYNIFAYNQSGALVSYQTEPLVGNQTTFPAASPSQPSALIFSSVTQNSLHLSFTNANPIPAGYLVIRKAGSAPTFLPSNGTVYNVDDVAGDATIVSAGSSIVVDDASLLPGTLYYYVAFSYTGSGNSTNYLTTVTTSNAGSALTLPIVPTANAASAIQQNQFTANWSTVTGATGYRIDVSTDDFITTIPGFTNLSATGSSIIVTGLNAAVEYMYRIRAENTSGVTASSNEIQVSTLAPVITPLKISAAAFPTLFDGTPLILSIGVSGGTPPYDVNFYHRKITEANYTITSLTSSSQSYNVTIDGTSMDEIGGDFYFEVTDASATQTTAKNYIYQSIPAVGYKIPFVLSGGTAASYEIFSIPYALNDNQISTIFSAFGPYDKSKWRLVHYQDGDNVDYTNGIVKIELGKSYWFNRKNSTDVAITEGSSIQVNQENPFILILESGWNQIGNPFPFNVDWDDTRTNAPDPTALGDLHVFDPVGLTLNATSNNLKTWSGGFIHNDGAPFQLTMPVLLKNTAGGRIMNNRIISNAQLDQESWFVPITITQNSISNPLTGIGMDPEASPSKDRFDDIVVPRFINYLELYTRHDNYFSPRFSKDVVPTKSSYSWDFNFESNQGGSATLQWDPASLGKNEASLLLYDMSANNLVDMKSAGQYSFSPTSSQQFRIFFGVDEKSISPDIEGLGNAYPNPFHIGTSIPFLIEHDQSMTSITIMDMMGRNINTILNGPLDHGAYSVEWSGNDSSGTPVAPGVYLYRMEINNHITVKRLIKF